MKLYGYFRSSAAYRVRIALNLKSFAVEHGPVHLLKGGGEQRSDAFRALNPQGLVPALELDDGTVLSQSLAIIEYLEAVRPFPRLIPTDPILAAKVRAVALAIACEIHPLNNLRVLSYLKGELGQTEPAINEWYQHWVRDGLDAIETMIEADPFCFCTAPTLADICLVPQVFNARRYRVDLDRFPKVTAVDRHCAAIGAFAAAVPGLQPDAQ
jgi:maleylacetoacetate isomerase